MNKIKLTNQNISDIYNDISKNKAHTKFITDWNHTHRVSINTKVNDTNTDTKPNTITDWYF